MENTENKNSEIPQSQTDGNAVLGEVAVQSIETEYQVTIFYEGKPYRWIAKRYKADKLHYTMSDIWCLEPDRIKNSVKKKMRKMVEDALSNLA